jgi:hypothetical protein
MAADFFVVPTATYRLLFVLVILAHQRRRIVLVGITAHPTTAWTAQRLREAFPDDSAPRYLLHDRDDAFAGIASTASGMGITERLTAPQAPWQNAYAERGDPINPKQVSGSRDRVHGSRIAPDSHALRDVLPRVADALIPEQGRAAASPGHAAGLRLGDRHSVGRQFAPSVRAPGRIAKQRNLTIRTVLSSALLLHSSPCAQVGRSGRDASGIPLCTFVGQRRLSENAGPDRSSGPRRPFQ